MADDDEAGTPPIARAGRDDLPLLAKPSRFGGQPRREDSHWAQELQTQEEARASREVKVAEQGLAIVNVSNKAQLKTEIIRAQAKADFEMHMELQAAKRARQKEEAEQAALLKNKKALAEKAAIDAKKQAEMMQNLMAEPHLEIKAVKPLQRRNVDEDSESENVSLRRKRLIFAILAALLVVIGAVVAAVLVLTLVVSTGVSGPVQGPVVNSLLADDESRPYVQVLVRMQGIADATYFTCVELDRKEQCKQHKSDARRAVATAIGAPVQPGDVLLRETVMYGESLTGARRWVTDGHLFAPPSLSSERRLLQSSSDDEAETPSVSVVFRIVCPNISAAVTVRDEVTAAVQSSMLGTRWKGIGEKAPATGTQINNELLANALEGSKQVFSRSDLEAFGVSDLTCNSYIKVSPF